jgi:hypothetical protein
VVAAALAPHRDALLALWRSRGAHLEAADDVERVGAALQPILHAAARDALERLYPGAWSG